MSDVLTVGVGNGFVVSVSPVLSAVSFSNTAGGLLAVPSLALSSSGSPYAQPKSKAVFSNSEGSKAAASSSL
ncbi:MAG: hypothetical protein WAN65_06795, partial [Candidatus Sulfotelmatobacter sp.]